MLQQHEKVANVKFFWDVYLNSWALILKLSRAPYILLGINCIPFILKPYILLALITYCSIRLYLLLYCTARSILVETFYQLIVISHWIISAFGPTSWQFEYVFTLMFYARWNQVFHNYIVPCEGRYPPVEFNRPHTQTDSLPPQLCLPISMIIAEKLKRLKV